MTVDDFRVNLDANALLFEIWVATVDVVPVLKNGAMLVLLGVALLEIAHSKTLRANPNVNASGYVGTTAVSPRSDASCHSHASYPDICFFRVPPSGDTVNCKRIQGKRFTVFQPDIYQLDGDRDGIGCES